MPEVLNPAPNCDLCPRLKAFREEHQIKEPRWFNAPVPSFGDTHADVLIIGLAPGLKGANATGRPFTGDWAGDLLYATLLKCGFASGNYQGHAKDGLKLNNILITNAVRCVPPQNKPNGAEINACRPFLDSQLNAMQNLKVLLSLGRISHDTTLRLFGKKLKDYPFAHGAVHDLENGYTLVDSYHCSRYNTNTGRLTEAMFEDIFTTIKDLLEA